jgi:hypothetical protein
MEFFQAVAIAGSDGVLYSLSGTIHMPLIMLTLSAEQA